MQPEYYVRAVADFHVKHGAPVGAGSTPEVLTLRQSLVYEEASEVLLAIHDRNELDLIDALGDLLYVTAGTVVAVHGQAKEQIHLPKRVSPAVWSPNYLHAITDMVGLVVNATTTRDFHPALYYCCQYPLEAGYPIRDIFDEIHGSNMSKQVTKDIRVRDKGPDYSPPDLRRFLRAT